MQLDQEKFKLPPHPRVENQGEKQAAFAAVMREVALFEMRLPWRDLHGPTPDPAKNALTSPCSMFVLWKIS
ncbi:hypothetical protein LXA47_19030 [Massilia sp. P8910]|uniref:hypothetical protein n=1 Tax=Massilia antarctica TaxID=2765360 RepID=UPI001E4B35A7|nr:MULTISPECIES: hypothetical protein [Massilia]MCE3605683.1 hypothetical protein [Massilia antarctica]MCY0912746.1 hypothetical protein [Massilia sp. H27-R4]